MSSRTITAVNVLDIQRRPLPSKHYVYVIEVTWSDGSVLTIYRRYSIFFEFHTALLDMFPEAAGEAKGSVRTIPYLPGKKLFERTNTRKHAMQRKGALQDYINALLKLPPQISACAHVKTFFSINEEDISPPTEEELQQRAPNVLDKATRLVAGPDEPAPEEKGMSVSTPMVLDQYRVLANYKKTGRSEVDVKEGDIVEVVEKNTNGWWFVNIDDAQGWLPATYLEPLDSLEPQEKPVKSPQGINYVSIQEFKTKEPDEIGFEKGVVVFVLETNLDGWWRVKYRDKEGWAPATCLRLLPSGVAPAVAVAQAEASRTRAGTNVAKAHPPRSTADHTEDRPMARTRDERGRLTASVVVADSIANRLSTAPASALARGKGPQPSAAAAAAAPSSVAEEVPSKPARPAARAATVVAKDAVPRPADRKASSSEEPKKAETSGSKTDVKTATSAATSAEKDVDFVVLQDFTSDDKSFHLRGGERVRLLDRGDGGWAFVRTAAGIEGWAPEDFLDKASSAKGSASAAATTTTAATATNTASSTPAPVPTPVAAAKKALPGPATPASAASSAAKPASAASPSATEAAPAAPGPGAVRLPTMSKPAFSVPLPAGSPTAAHAPPLPDKVPAGAMRLPAMSVSAAPRPTAAEKAAAPPVAEKVASLTSPSVVEKPRPAAKSVSATRLGATNGLATVAAAAASKVAAAPSGPGGSAGASASDYVVTEAYAKEDETGLSVKAGEKLTLIEQTDSGWWFMRNAAGAEGWVPSTFVTKAASASPVKQASVSAGSGASTAAAAAALAAGKGSSAPAAAAAAKPAVVPKQAIAPPTAPKVSASESPAVSSAAKTPAAAPRPAARSKNTYKVIDVYKAEDADSLSLVLGEKVEVVEKTDSGWWFARNAAGKEGWVPSTFLQEA